MSFIRKAGVAFLLATAMLGSVSAVATAAPSEANAPVVAEDVLKATGAVSPAYVGWPGYCWSRITRWSQDLATTFAFQDDGNLVIYVDGSAKWASWTDGRGEYICFQDDGNVVIYSPSGEPLWHSHTYGHPGNLLAVQNDGNVVVYSSAGSPLWNAGTYRR